MCTAVVYNVLVTSAQYHLDGAVSGRVGSCIVMALKVQCQARGQLDCRHAGPGPFAGLNDGLHPVFHLCTLYVVYPCQQQSIPWTRTIKTLAWSQLNRYLSHQTRLSLIGKSDGAFLDTPRPPSPSENPGGHNGIAPNSLCVNCDVRWCLNSFPSW